MALQDILAAIIAEADSRIAKAHAEHQHTLTAMREESERRLAKKRQEISVSKQQKMDTMKAKTQAHAVSYKRNAILTKKKELLDRTFESALQKLAKQSDAEIEPLLRACIKRIPGKGKIYPSTAHAELLKKICPSEQFTVEKPTDAVGGFLFVSEKEEHDYTFESIIRRMVRPRLELSVADILFS